MKKFLITSILAAIVAIGTAAMAPQDYPDEYLGLPGDNFNLYAVMNLFQQSETLEGFERSLNDENTRINNLDLNNDNYIDYVKVIDYVEGNVHTIVLQAILDRDDSQDVAVFTVEKLRDGSVQIQLIGDEALYGRNYIITLLRMKTPNPGYTGRAKKQNVQVVRTTYVAVDAWPVVRYIYLPDYRIWRSSWYWDTTPPNGAPGAPTTGTTTTDTTITGTPLTTLIQGLTTLRGGTDGITTTTVTREYTQKCHNQHKRG
jgi:hypothetical protein